MEKGNREWSRMANTILFIYLFMDFIYLFFRDMEQEGEREGEKHLCEGNIDWLPLICT